MPDIVSVKVTRDTRAGLRVVAALTGETQQAAMERLVRVEFQRLQARESFAAIGENSPS